MSIRDTIRCALKDPVLEVENNNFSAAVRGMLDDLSPESCISEWRHSLGEARYEYHVHRDDTLKQVYVKGVVGGNPRLIKIYSYDELKRISEMVPVGA